MILYHNGKSGILASEDEYYYYEVEVFYKFKNAYGLLNSRMYRCKFDLHIIPVRIFKIYFWVNTTLYAAPKSWLLLNGYTEYVKTKPQKSRLSSIQ